MQRFCLISRKLLFWLVTFLTAFIILFPKFPLIKVAKTFVAIRIEDLALFLVACLWFGIIYFTGEWRHIVQDKIVRLCLLFLALGGLATFAGIFLTKSVAFHIGVLHFLRRIEFLVLMPVVITAVRTKKQLFIFLGVLLGVTLLVNIYALGQQYLGWFVVSTTNSEFAKGQLLKLTPGARPNSTFAGYYDLAVFLVMMMVLMTGLFFYVKTKASKLLVLLLGGLSFFVLILTASRFSFPAAIFGVVMCLWLLKKRLLIVAILIAASSALAFPTPLRDRLVATVTVAFSESTKYTPPSVQEQARSRLNIPTLPNTFHSRLTPKNATPAGTIPSDITPGEPTDAAQLGVFRSWDIRVKQEWPRALRAFAKNPLLGTGYGSLDIATDNDILRSLGETGLLGTVSFALLIVGLARRLWKTMKQGSGFRKMMATSTICMIAAFVLNGLFIDVFEASKVALLFWIIVGLSQVREAQYENS